ncbi:hypothetical protein GCM10022223_61940 [Kineosporia mesophila]|uniref:Uncharacterized protein n=1 Tax=Kineosporia mesophila TaxID=566012 RepID=A0ABP7AL51_9ACTN
MALLDEGSGSGDYALLTGICRSGSTPITRFGQASLSGPPDSGGVDHIAKGARHQGKERRVRQSHGSASPAPRTGRAESGIPWHTRAGAGGMSRTGTRMATRAATTQAVALAAVAPAAMIRIRTAPSATDAARAALVKVARATVVRAGMAQVVGRSQR